jgi:hypothetical protein
LVFSEFSVRFGLWKRKARLYWTSIHCKETICLGLWACETLHTMLHDALLVDNFSCHSAFIGLTDIIIHFFLNKSLYHKLEVWGVDSSTISRQACDTNRLSIMMKNFFSKPQEAHTDLILFIYLFSFDFRI